MKIFTVTMSKKDFEIIFMAIHLDTLSELRTTIAITRAGIGVATLLYMGIAVAVPLMVSAAMKRKYH